MGELSSTRSFQRSYATPATIATETTGRAVHRRGKQTQAGSMDEQTLATTSQQNASTCDFLRSHSTGQPENRQLPEQTANVLGNLPPGTAPLTISGSRTGGCVQQRPSASYTTPDHHRHGTPAHSSPFAVRQLAGRPGRATRHTHQSTARTCDSSITTQPASQKNRHAGQGRKRSGHCLRPQPA